MTAIKGTNYTNNTATPKVQSNAGEVGGVKRVLFDQFLVGAVVGDVLSIGVVPKGARILEVKSVNAGTGAAFSVAPAQLITAPATPASNPEIVTLTIGTAPSDPVSAWVEYVVD